MPKETIKSFVTKKTGTLPQTRDRDAGKRAAQLERANAMLSRAIETFARDQSPEAYLDATLHAIAAALQADSATMWLWPGDGYAYLHRMFDGGVIVPGAKAKHPNARKPALIPDLPWLRNAMSKSAPTIELFSLNKKAGLTPEQIAHMRKRRVRALITVAIRAGNTVIGSFHARLVEGQPNPGPEQLALVRSMAAHAALSIEMGRLTKEARTGAVREERARLAREGERIARDWAARLERVNTVLADSIENFAIEQGPDAFLDALLRTIASVLDVQSVAMWRWPGDGYSYLHRLFENGVVLPGGQASHPNSIRPALLSEFKWTKEVIPQGKQITEIMPVEKGAGFTPEQIRHLRGLGVRALITATIRSGAKVIGSFSARLLDGQPNPDPERRALMRSLAAHGALALQMGRLTESARKGAIREERARIARDLHDSLAQGFTGIILQLEGVESALASGNLINASARSSSAAELARESLKQARRAVYALRPSILEDRDLTTALRELVETTFAGSRLQPEVLLIGNVRPLLPETEGKICLGIAQEALTNILRHARARHATLLLEYRCDQLTLRISDNGCGFKADYRSFSSHGGLGLIGIRERVIRLGGTLSIKNRASGGTSICVKLSLRRIRSKPKS